MSFWVQLGTKHSEASNEATAEHGVGGEGETPLEGGAGPSSPWPRTLSPFLNWGVGVSLKALLRPRLPPPSEALPHRADAGRQAGVFF